MDGRFEKQDGKRRKLQEELERREAEAAANAAYVARTGGAAQERMRKANQERMKAAASDRLRRENAALRAATGMKSEL